MTRRPPYVMLRAQVFSVVETTSYGLTLAQASTDGVATSIVPGVPTVLQATVSHPASNATVYWSLINGESTAEVPAGTTAAPRTAVRPSAAGTTFTLPAYTYNSPGTKNAILKLYSTAAGGSLLRYVVLRVMVESSDYTLTVAKTSPTSDATTMDFVSVSVYVSINTTNNQNRGPVYWSLDAGDGVMPPAGLLAPASYSDTGVQMYTSYPGGPGQPRVFWNPFAAALDGNVSSSASANSSSMPQFTLGMTAFKYFTGGLKTIRFSLWDAPVGGSLIRSGVALISVTKLSVSAALALDPTTTVSGTAYQRISTATVTGIDTSAYNYYFSFDMGPGGMYAARKRQSFDLTPTPAPNTYQINFLTNLTPEQLKYYSLGEKTARLQVFSALKTADDSAPMLLEAEAYANITVVTGVDIALSSNTAYLDQPSFTITMARVTGLSDGINLRCKLSLVDEDGNTVDYPAAQTINDSPAMIQPFTIPTMRATVDLLPFLGSFANDTDFLRPRISASTDPQYNYGFGQRYVDLAIYRPSINSDPSMPASGLESQEFVTRARAPLMIEDPAWSLNVSKASPFGNPTIRMPVALRVSFVRRPVTSGAQATMQLGGNMVYIIVTSNDNEYTASYMVNIYLDPWNTITHDGIYGLSYNAFRTPGLKTVTVKLSTSPESNRNRNIFRMASFNLTVLPPSSTAPAYSITRVRPTPINPVFGQPATVAVTVTRSSPVNATTAFICKLFNGDGNEPQSYAAYQALSGADKSARAVMAAGTSSATCTFTGVVYNSNNNNINQPGASGNFRMNRVLVFSELALDAVIPEPHGFDVSLSSVPATYNLVQTLTSMSPPSPMVGQPVSWTATISRSAQIMGSQVLEIECKLFTGEWTEPLTPDMYRRLPPPYTVIATMPPGALTATCVWNNIIYATAASGRAAKVLVFENGLPLFATAQQAAQAFTVMPARAATSLTVLPDQDDYVGCFRDAAVYEERRLPFYLYERFAGADLESCAQAARQAGLQYYGLQDGDICLGGNDLAAATSLGPADCTAPCRAETASVCGGAFANSIYRVVRSDTAGAAGNGTMLPDVPPLCEPGYLVHNSHYFFTGGLITSSDARLRAQARLADDGSFQPPRQLAPTAWQLAGGPAGGAASWLGAYSPRTACGWVFRTPPGSVTTLRIRYLNTESYFDRLEVWPLQPAGSSSSSSSSTATAVLPPTVSYSYSATATPTAAAIGTQSYLAVGTQTVDSISGGNSTSISSAAVGAAFPVYSRSSPADSSNSSNAVLPSCYCAPGSTAIPHNTTGPQIVYSRVLSASSILVVFSQPITVNLATCASAFVLQGALDGVPLAATIPFSSCGLAAFATDVKAAELPATATSGAALVLRLASGFDTGMIPAAGSNIGVNLIAGQTAVRQGSVLLPAGGSLLHPMPLSLRTLVTAPPFDTVDSCISQCRPPNPDAAPMIRAVTGVSSGNANPLEAMRSRGPSALATVSSSTPLAAFSGYLSQPEFDEPLLSLHNDFVIFFRTDAANHLNGFIIEYNVTTAAAAATYMSSYQTGSAAFNPAAYNADLNSYYSYRNRVEGDPYGQVVGSNATAGCDPTLYYQPPAAADGMWLLNCNAAGGQ